MFCPVCHTCRSQSSMPSKKKKFFFTPLSTTSLAFLIIIIYCTTVVCLHMLCCSCCCCCVVVLYNQGLFVKRFGAKMRWSALKNLLYYYRLGPWRALSSSTAELWLPPVFDAATQCLTPSSAPRLSAGIYYRNYRDRRPESHKSQTYRLCRRMFGIISLRLW